jgi:hypothetical protein
MYNAKREGTGFPEPSQKDVPAWAEKLNLSCSGLHNNYVR